MRRLDLGLYSQSKRVLGDGFRTHVNSKGKIPSTGKKICLSVSLKSKQIPLFFSVSLTCSLFLCDRFCPSLCLSVSLSLSVPTSLPSSPPLPQAPFLSPLHPHPPMRPLTSVSVCLSISPFPYPPPPPPPFIFHSTSGTLPLSAASSPLPPPPPPYEATHLCFCLSLYLSLSLSPLPPTPPFIFHSTSGTLPLSVAPSPTYEATHALT